MKKSTSGTKRWSLSLWPFYCSRQHTPSARHSTASLNIRAKLFTSLWCPPFNGWSLGPELQFLPVQQTVESPHIEVLLCCLIHHTNTNMHGRSRPDWYPIQDIPKEIYGSFPSSEFPHSRETMKSLRPCNITLQICKSKTIGAELQGEFDYM